LAAAGRSKPVVLAMLGGEAPLAEAFQQLARAENIIVSNSSDRTVRAMASALQYGNWQPPATADTMPSPRPALSGGSGVQAEWYGKEVLRALGIQMPEGALAQSLDEAKIIADRIGYPVVMKVQAQKLAHKTEVGGVLVNLKDAQAVERAWQTLHDNVTKNAPGVELDGILIEKLAQPGLELMLGARRDPSWGPTLVLGLGGIFVELFKDV